jgi:ribbon-helix-helix protein
MQQRGGMHGEQRTARLTILIDPRKKNVLERLCAAEDVTPSQLVRKLIRAYIEERLGRPWRPDDETAGTDGAVGKGDRRRASAARRR